MKVTLTFTPETSSGEWLGKLDADPDTSSWGTTEAGNFWFNTTDKKFKGWSGEEIILMG
jgi:hypothetical protein